jgi:molecular chaperone GrpE (heat shock protein)
MWDWLWRVLGAEAVVTPAPPAEKAPALPPPVEPPPVEPPPVEPPPVAPPPVAPELVETLEVTRKSARAQARLAARVDEVNDALNARLTELGAAVAALSTAARPGAAPASTWNEILDAMDLLDRAIDALPAERDDGLAEGLRGVLRRLDRALALNRVERRGEVGAAVDGRVFRVLGTEARDGIEGGRIARVVRAAALLDGKVLREGEVFATPGRTPP